MAAQRNHAVTEPRCEVAGFRGSGSQSQDTEKIALIVSEWPTTQQVFIAHGYHPMFIHTTQLLSPANHSIATQLRLGMFNVLWITMPSGTRMKSWGEQGTDKRLRKIREWMEISSNSSVPAVLYGFYGPVWEKDILVRLSRDGYIYRSTHRWCYFGVRMWKEGQAEGKRALPCLLYTSPSPRD